MRGSWLLPMFGFILQPGAQVSAQPSPQAAAGGEADSVKLFVCGDVMLGRGIDQVLPASVDPVLKEPAVSHAGQYVDLARRAGAQIPKTVELGYVWGDALHELETASPSFRIVNLETSITTNGDFWPGKRVHYRMHPDNAGVLKHAEIDVAVVANNHVLDFGRSGLESTISTLEKHTVASVGAGDNISQAEAPAVLPLPSSAEAADDGNGRLLVFALASSTSGVPPEWAATAEQSGVSLVGDLDRRSADAFATEVLALKRRGDLAVVSIHWGSNWGYSVPERQRDFAMRLIDAGAADIVYGHSSHHPRPLEVYKGRLILYGCGDFVNDYEGIGGHEDYRPDLTLMYFPEIDRKSGRLTELVMTPMRIEAFQLHRATKDEADWLAETLSQCSRPYGVSVGVRNDGRLSLEW